MGHGCPRERKNREFSTHFHARGRLNAVWWLRFLRLRACFHDMAHLLVCRHLNVRHHMRAACLILATMLIQLGLLGRLMADGPCCPDSSLEHFHDHDHSHDHGQDCDGSSEDRKCPSDCGDHRHHHGNCIHSMQISVAGECQHRLAPPHVVSLACERHDMRAPGGPVMELDKPPLIRASA